MFEQNEMILFIATYFFIGAICFTLLIYHAVNQGICSKSDISQITGIFLYTLIGFAWPIAAVTVFFHFLWAVANDYPDHD